MKSAAKYCMAILLVILAANWRGWNDGWYLLAGLAVVIPLAVFAAWRRVRARAREDRPDQVDEFQGSDDEDFATVNEPVATRESLVVGGMHGLALGVGLSVYLAGAFALLQQVPWLYDRYHDADRANIEAQLSTLEHAGNHAEAVALIEDRLTRKTGTKWRRTLSERLYGNLVQSAQQLPVEERLSVLVKALQLASTHKLDDTSARTLEAHTLREKALVDRIAGLQQDENWDAVVEVVKSELLRDDKSVVTARRLYDAYCTAAAHSENVDQRAAYYVKALDVAQKYSLPSEHTQAAMAQIGELRTAQNDTVQQSRLLAELDKEGAETRRELIEEMLNGDLASLSPDQRLVELRRIAGLAERFGVRIPSLGDQIGELDESIAAQRKFTEHVRQLWDAGKCEEAVSQLSAEVRTGDRQNWLEPIDVALLKRLQEWCDSSRGELVDQANRLRRAVEIARECGLEAPALQQRLTSVVDDLNDRDRICQRIATLKESGETARLISYLKVRIEEPESEWAAPYGEELCEALLTLALETLDLRQRCDLLREGLAVAQKYRHRSSELQAQLSDAEQCLRVQEEQERRRTTPAELPPGSNAGIVRVSCDERPYVIADVWVNGPRGAPVTGLKAKDFRVSVDGKEVPFFVRSVIIDPEPVCVAILVDTSGSVEPVIGELKSAIAELVRQLAHEKIQMKLIPFGANVNADCPWTSDATTLLQAAQAFEAKGETALYRALQTGCAELARKPVEAKRTLVVFTDGRNEDSVGGVSLDDVVQRLREEKIIVYAIGLRTNERKYLPNPS